MHILAQIPDHKKEMDPDTTSTGAFYPVRDSCNRDGDPEEGCVYTSALYYKVDIPFSNSSLPFTLSHDKSLIVEDTLKESSTFMISTAITTRSCINR